MTWWRKNSNILGRLLLLIAVWIPEVVVAYLAWNTPIWYVGAILAIIFCIIYGIVASLLTIAIIT
jgi:hypothetical protein